MEQKKGATWGKPGFPHGSESKASDGHVTGSFGRAGSTRRRSSDAGRP